MNGDAKFRVYNRCKYDIGVNFMNGQQFNIAAGSFIRMSVDDILYIEGTSKRKIFSSKMLVAVSDNGEDLTLEEVGGYTDTYAAAHLNDEEIMEMLDKPTKAVAEWLESIEDQEELFSIYKVSQNMDLPKSKLKLIQSKVPTQDVLADHED